MKTNMNFCSYFAQFFLEWEEFQTKFVDKINHALCSITFLWGGGVCAVCEIILKNIVESGRPQMAVWRLRIACWVTGATDTFRLCNSYGFFHSNNGCTNALHCYIMHTWPVLFNLLAQECTKLTDFDSCFVWVYASCLFTWQCYMSQKLLAWYEVACVYGRIL